MTHVSDPTDLAPDRPESEPTAEPAPIDADTVDAETVDAETVDADAVAWDDASDDADAGALGAANSDGAALTDRRSGSLLARAGRRIIRRPLDWIDAPWTAQRIIRTVTAFVFLIVALVITMNVVHWDLITTNNTPTGGDMGAHVMAPAYLRDHLLPDLRLSGWNPYWYDGFPLYRFYMVIPGLMIVLLNVLIPYGIAFKLVVVIGILTLPICCWSFGRLAKFAYPIPELFTVASLIFLLEDTKDLAILGGTVKSTMAGEFSFSIALSFAMLGLGLFAKGLETGKYRGRTAVILALAVLSHGIVAIFVLVAVALMALVWMDKMRFRYCVTTLLPMALLTAFWIIPFTTGAAYMTDMKYEGRPNGANDSYWKMFFPLDVTLDRIIFVFALIGFISCVRRRHLTGAWMGICIVALGVLCRFTQQNHTDLPVIGLLWNPRILPFINLLRYMLMMVGIAEVGRALVWAVGRIRVGMAVAAERRAGHTGAAVPLPTPFAMTIGGAVTAFTTLFVVLLMLAVEFQVDFFGGGTLNGRYSLSIGSGKDQLVVYKARSTMSRGLADSWSRYNFTGYEGKAAYGEYRTLIDDMTEIGNDPTLGCGRALWENNGDNGRYGTTMALMLMPHWTDGCIGSSEGLFFEASGTTPYHFLTAAAMSTNSSNPVRQLRYTDSNPAVGVPYMQELGIRYYMAWTDQAVAKADLQPNLKPIKVSGPWHIYEVLDSDIVTPLTVQPVVVTGRADNREKWLELGTSWFQNQTDWAAIPVSGGPADWQRVNAVVDESRVQANRVDVVVPDQPIKTVPLPAVTVSNVKMGNETVDFDVDQVGVPVIVKVSYFPNWEVTGGQGPWRLAPNLMLVIPTSNHVRMEFTRSTTDYIAYLLSLIGVILLFVFRKFVPIRYRSAHPFDVVAPMPVPASVGVGDSAPEIVVTVPLDDTGAQADPTPPDIPALDLVWDRVPDPAADQVADRAPDPAPVEVLDDDGPPR